MGKSKHNNSTRKRIQRLKITILSMLLMLTLVLLLLLSLGILSIPVGPTSSNHVLISLGRRVLHKGNEMEHWVEILSWEPRVFIYHNFLSKEECEYLITLAKPHLVKSSVIDSQTGKSKDSRVRTSSGMFLRRGQDKIVQDIEKRIADFTFIPVEYGEGLQVLRYEEGQKYEPHYDYFIDEVNAKKMNQRLATVLMYLSDVEEGGETVFPAAPGNFSSLPGWNERSECTQKGLFVKPKMGDALLFWSMKPDATLDPISLHGGCPVIKGTKWSSTKWLHVGKYGS